MSRRRIIAAVSSATALIILVAGYFLLTGHAATPRPQSHADLPKPPGRLTSPFTGEPIKRLGPELIFKIDNVKQARPPTGLKYADIIYLLPVEGGLSRIMAVFSSRIPRVVGPIRSAREEDVKLLRQFGRPAFAFSGAQPALIHVVERARIVDLYAGIAGGYYRDDHRVEPYNLYADTRTLLAQAHHRESRARDIGFRFGPAPPGGVRTRSFRVSYPAARLEFRWSAAQRRWLVWMDGKLARGAEGGALGGRTVVVQYVLVRPSAYRELGIKPPYATTVGSGRAVVLRNGRAYTVRWSRPTVNGGTTFTLPDGHRMLFAPGQVWVVFGYGPHSMA